MSGYVPKVGDRVRVTVEGVVTVRDPNGHNSDGVCMTRLTEFGTPGIFVAEVYFDNGEWERIEQPDPEFLVGDVWACNDHPSGSPLVLTAEGWINAQGAKPSFDLNGCDATLLIRDGKPVQP